MAMSNTKMWACPSAPERQTTWSEWTPEAELVHAARQGDVAAFGELWRRYERSARMVAGRLAPRDDIEDVVSETFLKVWRAMKGGGGPELAFWPYVVSAIRHVTISAHRRTHRVELTIDGGQLEVGSVASAEDAVVERSSHAHVRTALASLPDGPRSLLWKVDVMGLTPAQLGAERGITSNAVRCQLSRARRLLREALVPAAACAP